MGNFKYEISNTDIYEYMGTHLDNVHYIYWREALLGRSKMSVLELKNLYSFGNIIKEHKLTNESISNMKERQYEFKIADINFGKPELLGSIKIYGNSELMNYKDEIFEINFQNFKMMQKFLNEGKFYEEFVESKIPHIVVSDHNNKNIFYNDIKRSFYSIYETITELNKKEE